MAENVCRCGHVIFGHDDGRGECFTSGCKCRAAHATDGYTPTTEQVREAFSEMSGWDMSVDEADAAFDRWLAEVRAYVVAEEPEWEYGVLYAWHEDPAFTVDWESEAQARKHADFEAGDVLMRRDSSPRPWLPVEQGASDV